MKRTGNNPSSATYTQMGMAALLPGMQHMIELMQSHLDELRAQLAALQNGGAPATSGRGAKAAENGRNANYDYRKSPEYRESQSRIVKAALARKKAEQQTGDKRGAASSAYWARMTPEERSAEMVRRQALSKRRKQNGRATA